ncbi:MAG: hypothetical protein WAT81_01720 [Candidatus Moraniibacteriota bacterium]
MDTIFGFSKARLNTEASRMSDGSDTKETMMTTQSTLITSKDSKGLHFITLCETAYNKAKLDGTRAQRLNERGGELQAGLKKLIDELSVSDQYADEQVATNYNYPANYRPKPIAEQIEMIAKLYGLDGTAAYAYAANLPQLPEGAESWFAIPRWEAVGQTYGEATEKVLGLIGKSRKFKNWRENQLHERYLRQSEKTKQMFAQLAEKQSGDILIVPAQFGFLHRGQSVRRARETFAEHEFGLGAFAVGTLLLTHPEREVEWEQLHIDCSGDEYSPDAGGQFVDAPIFGWNDGKLHFSYDWTNNADRRYGSASGFLPQE